MPETSTVPRSIRIRAAIHTFIKERLDGKLDKLSDDAPKRSELIAQYQPAVWLEDAARRVRQIQAVTHALKPIHPDARGSNLYLVPEQLPPRSEIGSHLLGQDFSADIVGNAAALDVYKFLKIEIDGHSLLALLQNEDADAIHALDADHNKARQLRDAFVALTEPAEGPPISHPLAKQMYWLTGADPADDAAYHLLAPLYATSLAHAVYHRIQNDRSGETNTQIRQARRKNEFHAGVLHDYPNLAVQKLGGTQPQNISQLNSERRGNNYLLSCAPPHPWQRSKFRSPYKITSFFDRIYGKLTEVEKVISDLRHFLKTDPRPIMETRDRRDAYIDTLIDELLQLAAHYQNNLPAGWSRHPDIMLHEDECLWLDPYRARLPEEAEFRKQWLKMDWPEQIGLRFARWVNGKLEQYLPVGDIESRHWKKELLLDERASGWAQQLHQLCSAISADIDGTLELGA